MTSPDVVAVRLNLGCGPVQPAAWTNVDGSLRAWLVSHVGLLDRLGVALGLLPATDFTSVRYERLERRWTWPDRTVDAVYAGEILEHFTKEDGMFFLSECFRVLKPGGIVRIRVPDNARFWRNYVTEHEAMLQRPRSEWTLEHTRWIDMFYRDICVRRPSRFGSFGHFHKYGYDDILLIRSLEQVGFERARRREFLDSDIPDIDAVEVRDDLIVEAVKPLR